MRKKGESKKINFVSFGMLELSINFCLAEDEDFFPAQYRAYKTPTPNPRINIARIISSVKTFEPVSCDDPIAYTGCIKFNNKNKDKPGKIQKNR